MVIVETENDFVTLLEHVRMDDIVLDVVLSDSSRHPCNNDISLIFIHSISSKNDWCLPMMHNECSVDFDVLTEWYSRFIEAMGSPMSRRYVFDKKACVESFGSDFQFIDVNVWKYLEEGKIDDFEDITTNAKIFIESSFRTTSDLNQSIPIFKQAGSFHEKLSRFDFTKVDRLDQSFRFINDMAIKRFAELEFNGLFVDRELFRSDYGVEHERNIDGSNRIYTQYNLFTSTGRPSNRHGGINYAAMNKEDGSRKSFISRFGDDGMLVLIDYSAFHPRLTSRLANYDMPMDVDAYAYLASYFYNTKNPSPPQVAASKGQCFQQMYGGIRESNLHIPYFKATQTYINHRWSFFEKNGYVETPLYGRRIKPCHIDDPTPNKLFNYILQAYETEMAVRTLGEILDYLTGKKSKAILYTYDSLLFDVHKSDGISTVNKIKEIMMGGKFPVKIYAGKTYDNMPRIHI